jgi:predicted RNA-binding Zn-ribbon protein involved in translation (DUF1610 family)
MNYTLQPLAIMLPCDQNQFVICQSCNNVVPGRVMTESSGRAKCPTCGALRIFQVYWLKDGSNASFNPPMIRPSSAGTVDI